MSRVYSSPLRVYLLLGLLAAAGIYSGLNLPVSLFPNSSKPTVNVRVPYGDATPEEFLNTFGKDLEDQLRRISTDKVEVEKVEAEYRRRDVDYEVKFKWGVQPTAALREVQFIVNSFSSRFPEESRLGTNVNIWAQNSGFFAVSYYSTTRDLDALYDLLEPILTPRVRKVADASEPSLFNPSRKEIRVQLDPEAIAALQLFPNNIQSAILSGIQGRTGGSITSGINEYQIEMPRLATKVQDLARIVIPTPAGGSVHLGDVSRIDLGPVTNEARSFKTNGAPSLILFATPKPGGNVKRMSEELLEIVKQVQPTLPKDVQYRVLVDPSEFIRSSINNVFHEVAIAALLAVAVLFLFIGSFRNVITAAIEIPLSMVLAFILMRITGMNLNMISLGGLALSAGMNVDASVVVMENIFRHFEMHRGPHDSASRLRILVNAVNEVRFPILASTIASLVVFLPLTFTSDLSFAILGDLALAVVFSHGFSAFIALLLVPTVRLQLMARGGSTEHHSRIEPFLHWLENAYSRALGKFILGKRVRLSLYLGLGAVFLLLAFVVLPRLPKEIVGIPDTDWLVLDINTEGNTILRQMEAQSDEIEREMLKKFGSKIYYTFTMVNGPNRGTVMARLLDKKDMKAVWHGLEKTFTNTPLLRFFVSPWNPSELPIPDPPHLKVSVRGGTLAERTQVTRELKNLLQENRVFPNIWTYPNVEADRGIIVEPHSEQWDSLMRAEIKFKPTDITDLIRVATQGRWIGQYPIKTQLTPIILKFPKNYIENVEDISSIPIGVGAKIVPLKSLAEVKLRRAVPSIHREDGQELCLIEARQSEADKAKAPQSVAKAKKLIEDWKDANLSKAADRDQPVVAFEEADKDLNDAIRQLTYAVVFSIGLIFLTMLVQFGTFVEPLLVLVSIPLGFIGVILSLFVFRSTLSLNSILGVILLNGIAVANSIILVDFIKRLVDSGLAPREAALEAAKKRLRPILITSLTTVLGMLPIAFGLGEGGRILQPLGIAVSGGLWVSTTLTLFLVPSLQVAYLEWKSKANRFSWIRGGMKFSWRLPFTKTRPVSSIFPEERS